MSLTPGTTLQDQKYVIQQQLHHSNFGVIYQAQHRYLEQAVVLHTLPESVQQQPDFAQLRQHFLQQVRSIAQNPPHGTRLVDCFEEQGLPFAVFEVASESSLQESWPSFVATVATPSSDNSLAVPVDRHVADSKPASAAAVANAPVEATLPPAAVKSSSAPLAGAVTQTQTDTVVPPPELTYAQADSMTLTTPDSTEPKERATHSRSNWLPIGLVAISVAGGLVGVGLGLSLRLALSPSTNQTNAASVVKPGLFSREQAFPATTDWPISETPQYPTETLPIEQPVYLNSTTEDYTVPRFQAVPDQEPTSDFPVSAPSVTSNETLKPLEPAEPAESAPPPAEPAPAALALPNTSQAESAPSQPIEPPASEPLPLAAPEEPIPGLPPLEASPVPLSTGETSAIQQ